MRTARGCPFACPYCAAHLLCPGGWQPRDPLQVVDEIARCARDLSARDVAFYDDALLIDAEHHIVPLLETVIARRLPVRFHTPNGLHARYLDRPLARLMRRAGFATVRLGLESADPLLHNNSIYPCGHAEEWEALKARIRAANHALYP